VEALLQSSVIVPVQDLHMDYGSRCLTAFVQHRAAQGSSALFAWHSVGEKEEAEEAEGLGEAAGQAPQPLQLLAAGVRWQAVLC